MNALEVFIQLRVTVAVLGEKPAAAWWDSSFLDETGMRSISFRISSNASAFRHTGGHGGRPDSCMMST